MDRRRFTAFEINGKFKCRFCKQYDRPSKLVFNEKPLSAQHKKCANAYQRERRDLIKKGKW